MKDENCIFCKLANGEIPTNTLYEDADFRVIMDNAPAAKGHALVIPKEHFADVYAIDEKTIGGAAVIAKKMAKKISDELKCDGVNILQNNGPAAGQTVFHYHLHVIPRYEGDESHLHMVWEPESYTDEEIESYKTRLQVEN